MMLPSPKPCVTLCAGAADEPWRIGIAEAVHKPKANLQVAALHASAVPLGLAAANPSSSEQAQLLSEIGAHLEAYHVHQAMSILSNAFASAHSATALERLSTALAVQRRGSSEEQQGIAAQTQLPSFAAVGAASANHESQLVPPLAIAPPPGLEACVGQQAASGGNATSMRAGARGVAQPTNVQQPAKHEQSSSFSAGRPPQKHTLSTSLRLLADEDPYCVFIVRRISKLGFKASQILKQHFSAQGQVVRVLVAHSTVRQQSDECASGQATRRRPSSLGFVQMQSPEAARRVLANGSEQEIKGVAIHIQKFEHKAALPGSEEQVDNVQDDPVSGGCIPWQRMASIGSVTSDTTFVSRCSSADGWEQSL